ncbi:MAG: DUF481 domain-containing protein, partial [Chitinophagaceae bacterium]|nr:DUF481 domain-containing protein [Chitinophagaceae bacterium]
PTVTFDIAQTFYYSLSQAGRFRNDGTANLTWEIINDLKLNISFYNNYDSKPPTEGSNNFDFGVTVGLKYFFY